MNVDLTSLISSDDLFPVVMEEQSMIGIVKLLNSHVKSQEQRIKSLEQQIAQMLRRADYVRDHDALIGRLDDTEKRVNGSVSRVTGLAADLQNLEAKIGLTITERMNENIIASQMQIRFAMSTLGDQIQIVDTQSKANKTQLEATQSGSKSELSKLAGGLRTLQDRLDSHDTQIAQLSERHIAVPAPDHRPALDVPAPISAPKEDVEKVGDDVAVLATRVEEFESRFESFKEKTGHTISSIRDEVRHLSQLALTPPKVTPIPVSAPPPRVTTVATVESDEMDEIDVPAPTSGNVERGGRPSREAEISIEVDEEPPAPPAVDVDAIVRQLRDELNVEEMHTTFDRFRREHVEAMSLLDRKIDRDYVERLFNKFRALIHALNDRVKELATLGDEYARREELDVIAKLMHRMLGDVRPAAAVKKGPNRLFCGRPKTALRGQISPRTAAAAGTPPVRSLVSEFPGPEFIYGDGQAFRRDEFALFPQLEPGKSQPSANG
jgi:archaellum component FlaC